MSSLNILCGICNEFYTANDIIYSTKNCGHVFHYGCLTRWLNRSLTCPQCRSNCHRQKIHRIYLNFSEFTPGDEVSPPVNPIQWVPIDIDPYDQTASAGVPSGAIQMGTDHEGLPTYIARVYYEDDLLPANYVPEKKGAYTPWGCHAHLLQQTVEVLVGVDCKWVRAENGNVPQYAIPTGYTENGESLYTGRGQYEGLTILGKVHPSHRVLYMPYQGREVNVNEYEVLIIEIKKHAEH